jgi:hypothetical protein
LTRRDTQPSVVSVYVVGPPRDPANPAKLPPGVTHVTSVEAILKMRNARQQAAMQQQAADLVWEAMRYVPLVKTAQLIVLMQEKERRGEPITDGDYFALGMSFLDDVATVGPGIYSIGKGAGLFGPGRPFLPPGEFNPRGPLVNLEIENGPSGIVKGSSVRPEPTPGPRMSGELPPAPGAKPPYHSNPNLSPTRVTPETFGLKSVADDQKALELYNETLRELANSKHPNGNAYQRYLQKLEEASRKGVPPEFTSKELAKAFDAVSENYLRRLRSNGLLGENEVANLHHWNFNKKDFPLQIADSRNLYLIKGTESEVDALHTAIHQATSANSRYWNGPIHPNHVIPLQPQSPYTPPR